MKPMALRILSLLLLGTLLALSVGCGTAQPPSDQSAPHEQGPVLIPHQTTPSTTESRPDTSPAPAAPDFTVLDADGNSVKLSDFIGRPVVLNFWATWCPPCKAEMPDLQAAYETYGDEICFVMVNLTDGTRDTVDSVKAFAESSGYTFPVYFDTQSSAALAYSVYSIPNTYFINAEGKIVLSVNQMITAEQLENGIQKILS